MKFKVPNDNRNIYVRIGDVRASSFPVKDKANCRSQIQYEVGQFLLVEFPNYTILEDWTIPSTRLSLDFLIMPLKIAVEVQGRQHFERNTLFHQTHMDFINQQKRDQKKRFFCELNDIILLEVEKFNYREVIQNGIG